MEQPSQSTVSRFFSEHRLPASLLLISLVIVIIGLIVFFWPATSNESDVVFSVQPSESSTPSKAVSKFVMVDVSGAVTSPGVYTLPANQRIQDAISKAGGFSSQADTQQIARSINLATKLRDGMKIYIPHTGEVVQNTSEVLGAQAVGVIGINSASSDQLDSLPGVGKVTADKIIANRPYQTLDELVSKKVLSSKVLAEIKEKVSLD